MATVTLDLLDSMLTPTPGQPAEALYRSIPLSTRVRDLTLILGQLYSNAAATAANNNNDGGRSMLAAVLLRREITTLAGNEAMVGLSTSNAIQLMGEIAEPLMTLFALDGAPIMSNIKQSRRQIGHCIAELCCSLSVQSPADGREWLKSVLGRLGPGVSVTQRWCM